MKKVLIIAYNFPPIGGVGAIRIAKFAKFLPEFGWEPIVVTSAEGFSHIKDESLLEDLPKMKIIRVPSSFEPQKWCQGRWWQSFWLYLIVPWFISPDRQASWINPAYQTCRDLIKKEQIDLIFSSSGPASNHFVAKKIRQETGIKWVADFRDEWANNPHFKYPTSFHHHRAARQEKDILRTADQIISVSEPLTDYLAKVSGSKEKCHTITNGFDPADFTGPITKKEGFNLLHAGILYGTGKDHLFFEAFRELNLPEAKFEFIGQDEYLPHKQAVRKMREADCLILILSPKPRATVLSGKIFEYLAARKPILALIPAQTAAATLIKETNTGVVVDPQDKKAIKKEILNFYRKWQKNELNVPPVNLDKYGRKNLTKKLVEIFNHVASPKPQKICLIVNSRSRQSERLSRYLLNKNYQLTYLNLSEGELAGQGILGKIKSFLKLKQIIKNINPDIIHGHGLNFAGIFAVRSGFHPVVVTVRGSDVMQAQKMPGWLKNQVIKTLQQADIVTGSSEALKNRALELGMPKDKYRMVFFGIDGELFKPKNTDNLRKKLDINNEKIIFSCRALKPIYNIDILIKAVSQFDFPFKLILVKQNADQAYLAKLEQLIKENHLKDKVKILPAASEEEMVELYNLADVVVSIAQSDGLSVSFLEAMACEKKIVISNVGFVKEWSFDYAQDKNSRKNFWITPIGDIEETAQNIEKALNMPDKEFEPIGKKNRELVLSRAEMNKGFEALEKIYKRLKP